MTAYLGYGNAIAEGTINAGETPGFEAINATDWFTYTWWKAPDGADQIYFEIEFTAARNFDYFAVAAHDLDVTASYIRMQVWDGEAFVVVGDPAYSESNAPVFQIFENPVGPSTRWRFHILTLDQVAPHIGVLSLGNVLALPEGIRAPFIPPPVAYDNKVINSVSQGGQFLGRSIERYGEKMTINQNLVAPSWMRQNWPDLADAVETQPFFYSWNYEEYPEDTVYAWLDEQLTPPHYTSSMHVSFDLKCKSLHRIRWF